MVYLPYLPSDNAGAIQVKQALRQAKFDVTLFRYDERDPRMLERIHRAALEKSDGVVVFYGADAGWAYEQMLEVRDYVQARKRKQNPLKAVCLCDGPPETKESSVEFEAEYLIVADCRDGVQPSDLATFVEAVRI